MKAVVLAYHNICCIGLEALLENGFEVAAVFTHRDSPGENIWFKSVAELAARKGLPVYAPENINHPLWIERIRKMAPDIIFSFYYRKLVSQPILDIPGKGALNLHGSLLPKYRGRSPINWVLVNGEKETGVTLHYMTRQADQGDIVARKAFPITGEDTALDLFRKAEAASRELLGEALPLLKEGKAPRAPQDHSRATYFGGRTPADGKIDWNQPAAVIHNLVRAVTHPYPGAFTSKGGKKLFIWRSRVKPGKPDRAPGTVIAVDPLTVACGRENLEILEAQPEEGLVMSGDQAGREIGLVEGARLGDIMPRISRSREPRRVLILGVGGFIGNALGAPPAG